MGESAKESCLWEISPRYRLATCSKGTLALLKSFQWQPRAMSTVGQGDSAKEPGVRSLSLSSLHLATDTTIPLSHNFHLRHKQKNRTGTKLAKNNSGYYTGQTKWLFTCSYNKSSNWGNACVSGAGTLLVNFTELKLFCEPATLVQGFNGARFQLSDWMSSILGEQITFTRGEGIEHGQ